MGWFSESSSNKKAAAQEKISDAVENSKNAIEGILKKTKKLPKNSFDKFINSKLRKGTCAGCNRPISKDGYYHKKCSKAAGRFIEMEVAHYISSMDINLTNFCNVCDTNLLTTHAHNRPSCCQDIG